MNILSNKNLLILIVSALILLVGYYVLNKPDQRNAAQKIGDAVNELPNGVTKASRQLENRTPGDKLEDAAQDAKDSINKATNSQ